jgi:hypothetical protein
MSYVDMSSLLGRDADGQDRYTSYLNAVRIVRNVGASEASFKDYIARYPRLERIEVTRILELDIDLPSSFALDILRAADGSITRIRVTDGLAPRPDGWISRQREIDSLAKSIRSLVSYTFPLDMLGDDWKCLFQKRPCELMEGALRSKFSVERFEVFGYEDHTRLALRSVKIPVGQITDETELLGIQRLIKSGRILSVELDLKEELDHLDNMPLARARHFVNTISAEVGPHSITAVYLPPATLDDIAQDLADWGRSQACQLHYEIDVTSDAFIKRDEWRISSSPSGRRPQKDARINFIFVDRSSIYEDLAHRHQRLVLDRRWILELARLCVSMGGPRGVYTLEYRHTCTLPEPPMTSAKGAEECDGDVTWQTALCESELCDSDDSEDGDWSEDNNDNDHSDDSEDSEDSDDDWSEDNNDNDDSDDSEDSEDSDDSDDSDESDDSELYSDGETEGSDDGTSTRRPGVRVSRADLRHAHANLTVKVGTSWSSMFNTCLTNVLFPEGMMHPGWARLDEA